MEAVAYIKYIKISPKKLRFIVDGIRKQKPVDAMTQLSVSQTKGAKMLYKAIRSAVYNARALMSNGSDSELRFKSLFIEEGPYLKRMRAASRGRAHFYKKRSSHIKVVITGESIKKSVQKINAKKQSKQLPAQKKIKEEITEKKKVTSRVKKNKE